MSSRPQTPSAEAYGSRPTSAMAHSVNPNSHVASGTPRATDFASHPHGQGASIDSSPLSQSGPMHGNEMSSMVEGDSQGLERSDSQMSQSQTLLPSRGGTLKKKASLRKMGSVKRSGSRRSSRAGSVRSLNLGDKPGDQEMSSAFHCPIPTNANPTEGLANRFQAWRKVLKDLITYFRDIQKSYETRSKALAGASNVMTSIMIPSNFLTQGGLGDSIHILRDFHKNAANESNKARDLENEVILQLTGLRSDLQQKIKEIKSLSGDFKNSVDRETDGTRRAVRHLQETLGLVDSDPASTSGRGDPFLIKMSVDRQLERQIEEENYLHRAYLNLESSGRELESIVVGEIQKAYNAYAGILKREADESYETAEKLREGPVALPKDKEWNAFVAHTDQMVDPKIPLRQVSHIDYPGKDHPAAIEVRSGMLERKSKYLKNYTPGWYVLSPTHLHEFKSADSIHNQQPIMSLYLPEQKLGSRSEMGSGSPKFMLKGRQTGSMHRGHSWIFRAESFDTMMAWFNDIKELTEKRGEERNAFVRRQHARSVSGHSVNAPSMGGSSDGAMEEDEADAVPYSDERSVRAPVSELGAAGAGAGGAAIGAEETPEWTSPSQTRTRPQPGGRFPSDVNVNRGLSMSPSSGESSPDFNANTNPPPVQTDHDALAAASSLPGSGVPFSNQPAESYEQPYNLSQNTQQYGQPATVDNYISQQPAYQQPTYQQPTAFHDQSYAGPQANQSYEPYRAENNYNDWAAPAVAGAAVGAGGAALASNYHQQEEPVQEMPAQEPQELETHEPTGPIPSHAVSSSLHPDAAPVVVSALPEPAVPESPLSSRDIPQTSDTTSQSTAPTSTSLISGGYADSAPAPTETSRPSMPHPAKSAMTISDLHIPGEFPKREI